MERRTWIGKTVHQTVGDIHASVQVDERPDDQPGVRNCGDACDSLCHCAGVDRVIFAVEIQIEIKGADMLALDSTQVVQRGPERLPWIKPARNPVELRSVLVQQRCKLAYLVRQIPHPSPLVILTFGGGTMQRGRQGHLDAGALYTA